MKEYTITMSFSVESEKSNLEKINLFADELSQKILDDDNLVLYNDIEIIDATVVDVLDLNNYDFDEDEDDTDEDEDY